MPVKMFLRKFINRKQMGADTIASGYLMNRCYGG